MLFCDNFAFFLPSDKMLLVVKCQNYNVLEIPRNRIERLQGDFLQGVLLQGPLAGTCKVCKISFSKKGLSKVVESPNWRQINRLH